MSQSDPVRLGAIMPRRHDLISPLSPDEVSRHLKATVASEWTFFSDKPFRGKVDERSFRIRKNIGYRNSFQTHLYGTLHVEGGQTRVKCTARMRTFVMVFMTVWFGLLFGISGPWFFEGASAALAGRLADVPPLLLAIPATMLVFGIALVFFGRWLARNEEAELLSFLEETIDA